MFYHFRQNNSGGFFDVNDNVTYHVIIEADTAEDACYCAEQIGIYFDGVNEGRDCECCGDRWSTYITPSETPTLYGEFIDESYYMSAGNGEPGCHVYYKDGKKTTHYPKP